MLKCYLTQFDINVEWVQCDTCDSWYHTMCKVLTPLEQLSLSNSLYKCLCCTLGENLNRADVYNTKISALIEEEDAINEIVVIA